MKNRMQQEFEGYWQQHVRFYQAMEEVFAHYDKIEESEDGYTLIFPAQADWRRRLDQLVPLLHQRYQAIEVEVVPDEEHGQLRLRVSGSDRVKGLVERIIASAQSGSMKPPSVVRAKVVDRWRRMTSRLRTLPHFIIVGAPKCGTTSLYNYLLAHPQVLPASRKELAFFDFYFDRRLSSYRSRFPLKFQRSAPGATRGAFVTGEATPSYLMNPQVPERIAEMLPRVKLIAMLRNPVKRAISHYHLSARHGFEDLSLEEALDREEERLEGELEKVAADEHYWSYKLIFYSYLTGGIYVDQIKRWMDVFPRENLLVVCTEELAREPVQQFRRVLGFLELPEFERSDFEGLNTYPYPKPSTSISNRLAEYFRPHNDRLWELLGVDYGWNGPSVSASVPRATASRAGEER